SKIAAAGEKGRAERALLLSLAALRVAVEGSGPYDAELAAARTLAGDRQEMKDGLAPLADDAKTGVPSTAALAERFDRSVAPAILRARGEPRSGDWWQQIRARLERLVVIRRVAPGGPAPRDATEAAVSKAAAALRAGDLAHAVAALDDLSGDAALAAAPWLAQARRRLDAEAALAKLWRDAVAKAGDDKSEGKP
ncbi:MAG: COG4223 family protein, partial [Stellaceae bacterium]